MNEQYEICVINIKWEMNLCLSVTNNFVFSNGNFCLLSIYWIKKIFKKLNLIKPSRSKILEKTLALFDIGSQSSFISQKFADRLKLKGIMQKDLKLFSFGNKFIAKNCLMKWPLIV